MPLTRRDTLGLAASTLAATLLPSVSSAEEAKKDAKIELVLFDAFPVFDPRPIFESLETMAPGRGEKLGELWRNRQFAYTWLRTVAGEYEDFWKVTRDGLLYAAEAMDVVLSPRQVEKIMNGYLTLKAWPDAPAALETLKAEGLRLAFLSNFTPRMLGAAI